MQHFKGERISVGPVGIWLMELNVVNIFLHLNLFRTGIQHYQILPAHTLCNLFQFSNFSQKERTVMANINNNK